MSFHKSDREKFTFRTSPGERRLLFEEGQSGGPFIYIYDSPKRWDNHKTRGDHTPSQSIPTVLVISSLDARAWQKLFFFLEALSSPPM